MRDCSSKIQNICYDPSSQVCKQLDNSSLYGYCVNNGNCQQIDINQFIGRDTNFNCLTSLQQLNLGQTIQYCFNDPQSICQKSDQTSCVKYQDNYQIYLGYISGTGFCAQQNQKTSNIQLQQITNLNPNFCQDENFQIVQIQIPYVGRETNYSKCLKVNSQANSLIEFCISGYCIWNNTCQQIGFDKINISKLSNLQCAPQQQPGAIECGYRYLNVCMLNQMCYCF
ncbi:hypothetical protein TTHERM_01081710 (macronuclear) [Tetrahymena thermophila SB210]|uniref:Uncharacterized protein n=1 Tax=Tetrahymena thermophila (strain SB210) TaxID=312017 RepID=Q22BZ8_TETTS|nr:hypothetical protein TTHERM_01081710 [Tetrahymena thermophila SB210]EAR82811.2 hypothetical protein TTHERM_01081710 [Tetrahymena thermophila SB210]|eukprot:XP_001030474.2 hypothetical protein TTHERM_01081710 [Tetrahymena thermophila SB210]